MTFDELFKDHNLTPAERATLVGYLAHLRAQATRRALATPPDRIGGPCGVCGQPNAHHGGGACPAAWRPEFDAIAPEQERLAREFCHEIAGPRGKPGTPPDPVRLLEMAQALYLAELAHAAA